MANFDVLMIVMSFVNVTVYFVSLAFVAKVLYSHGHYGFAHAFRASIPEIWRKRSAPPPNNGMI
jgi:hypothetical protein